MEALGGATNLSIMEDGAMEAIDMDYSNAKGQRNEELSPEQREMIQKLRERVLPELKPEWDNESYLEKWLIARNFNLDQGEEMLKKHLRFMKLNKLDETDFDTLPKAHQYFFTARLGYDKEGSVVRMLHVGASDTRGLCYSLSKLDCYKIGYYYLKDDVDTQKVDRANDTLCDKHVYIIDLQGMSWSAVIQRIVINRTLVLLKSYEENYPERLKVVYVLNAPSFFSFIYNWLKTILPESVLSKLEIVSLDEFQSKIRETIDLSILPAVYGGTRTDPNGDPMCNSLFPIPLGTPVPEELMSTDHMENLKNDPDAKKITVEYRALFIVEKEVLEPNSLLNWDFQTLENDIRMGLSYRCDEESNSEEIIPVHRVDCHIFPESGSFMCERPGIYEVVFDNTYSWFTSKELLVKVNLELPGKDTKYDY